MSASADSYTTDIAINKNKFNIMNKLDNIEVEKAKALIIVEIIEYVPNSVVIKTIIKKTTGNVSAISFDTGEALTEKIIPFDTFVQIIDGKAEIVINGISTILNTGQSIIIPAHTSNIVKANERFKMISTIIKSGYE
jgi:quercetin dioxygenase-like cupin family protein